MPIKPCSHVPADIHAPREQYKYFYDEKDPASVLAGMGYDFSMATFMRAACPNRARATAARADRHCAAC